METSKRTDSRITSVLVLGIFVILTTGFILIGAHLQMLQGVMPVNNLNGLYFNMDVNPIEMIPIPVTGSDYQYQCKNAIICDDFSGYPVDWSSKGSSIGIQFGALHVVTGLFPKAKIISWDESNDVLPEKYSYSADLLTSNKNDTAGLAINILTNSKGTVFLFNPGNQSFFIGQWNNRKLTPIVDWKSINLKTESTKYTHFEIQCVTDHADFFINGTHAATTTLTEPCNIGFKGIFLEKASWQLWADNVMVTSIK